MRVTKSMVVAIAVAAAWSVQVAGTGRAGMFELVTSAPERREVSKLTLKARIKVTEKKLRNQFRGSFEMLESLPKPISIALMTSHFFGSQYARKVENCSVSGQLLDCSYYQSSGGRGKRFSNTFSQRDSKADAMWWHGPASCGYRHKLRSASSEGDLLPFKARQEQLSVIMSMESAAYYKCLADEDFMSSFDVEMTYRKSTADIPLLYWSTGYKETWEQHPPLPPSQKKDAVIFVNSNCAPPSNRTKIVAALRDQPGVTVDARGRCLNAGKDRVGGGYEGKYAAYRTYRYCITMENSIAVDYVTEKVYDGLAAGCLPIYLGAPNIADFIPSMDGILHYPDFGSPEALAAELRRLSADDAAYQKKFEWMKHPESWGPAFKETLQAYAVNTTLNHHPQCQLCQMIALHRASLLDQKHGRRRWTSNGGAQSRQGGNFKAKSRHLPQKKVPRRKRGRARVVAQNRGQGEKPWQ